MSHTENDYKQSTEVVNALNLVFCYKGGQTRRDKKDQEKENLLETEKYSKELAVGSELQEPFSRSDKSSRWHSMNFAKQ